MLRLKRTSLALAVVLAISSAAVPASAQDDTSMAELLENAARILKAADILAAVEKSILVTDQDCPSLGEGWKDYKPIAGRFALAAGRGVDAREEMREFEPHGARRDV